MRIGQLARKLALSPSDIIEFLNSHQFQVAEGANARIDKEQLKLVLQRFVPERAQEIIADDVETEDADIPSMPEKIVEMPTPSDEVIAPVEIVHEAAAEEALQTSSDENPDKVDVIKAPKVTLSGLKVLGKIELPEKKKKGVEDSTENKDQASEVTTQASTVENTQPSKPSPRRPNANNRNDRREQRPRKNPVALAREREAHAAEEKRKEDEKRKKEQRTDSYYRRVKAVPTKSAKLNREEVVDMSQEDLRPAPKTWIGKFWKWFRS